MSEPPPQRTAGFRFWPTDALFIAACGAGAWFLRNPLGEMVWLVAVAVGHFFLFCNVFRVRRSYELIWTAIFIINMIAWFLTDTFSWGWVLGIQAPVTAAVIALEMRSSRYHGIFCRSINAEHLDRWLAGEMFH